MTFRVIFEYDEGCGLWEPFVEGAANPLEAVQGFNAVVLTAQDVEPSIETNKAVLEPDGRYKIWVGQRQQ